MSIYLLIGVFSSSIVLLFFVAVVRRALRFSRGGRKVSQVASVEISREDITIRVQPWQVASEDPFESSEL